MSLPFAAAKTRIPLRTSNLVPRPRLLAALDTCLQPDVQVILVAAPAGAGKTTLLAQWLGHLPPSLGIGWLSLDAGDNSLTRFLAYLFAAIPNLGADFATQVEANPTISAEQGIAFLVEQASEVESDLLLVLDDYHVITAPEIHQALKLLLDHLPPNLRLVIAGRVEPPLPLARLRARGKLVDVRAADLRFSVDETAEFLARFTGMESLAGQESLSQRLADSTEGWAAGLQMSVLALRRELSPGSGKQVQLLERFVDGLDGSQRYILDYLLEEVLSREPDHVREFLLRTCPLERFNADLCACLFNEEIDAADAQSMLEQLERSNLFIVPLDNKNEWFRYHHLFADMLQKQLFHLHPGLVLELHRRAANWFERQSMLEEAIHHAQRSGDDALPRVLVEKHALGTILRGQIATAISWLESLPAEVLMSSPRLCLDRAWALTFTSRTEAAVPYLERAETLLADTTDRNQSIRSEILGLQSFRESMYGHPDLAIQLARQALAAAPTEHSLLQCSNRLFLAGALAHTGQLEEALQQYHNARPFCETCGNLTGLVLLEADFLHDLAIFLYGQDAARQAQMLLEQAIARIETSSHRIQPAALFLYVGLGKILLMENRLVEAERYLEKGLQLDPAVMTVGAIDGTIALWRIKLNRGDFVSAQRIISQLEKSTQGRDPKITRLVSINYGLQDLVEGRIAKAEERLSKLGLSGNTANVLAEVSDSELVGWQMNEFFTYARLLIAQKRYSDSLLVLTRLEKCGQEVRVHWMTHRAQMFQAIAWHATGNLEQALSLLKTLLDRTSRIEANPARLYLEPGEPARALLLEIRRRGIHPGHVTDLLAAFPPRVQPEQIPDSPEKLSEREVEVLRLMSEGLRNQEIADRLVVSLNTVRYHSKNIFSKLGVDNRTAAVARAREISLLC